MAEQDPSNQCAPSSWSQLPAALNSLCTADLNVAQDNSMQVPGERNSRKTQLRVCVCGRRWGGLYFLYNVLVRICGFHAATVNPWVWNTCVYWANLLRRPSPYWFLQTWMCVSPNVHWINCFAIALGIIQANSIDFFCFFWHIKQRRAIE